MLVLLPFHPVTNSSPFFFKVHVPKMTHPEGPHPIFQVKSADILSPFGLRIVGVFVMKRIIGVFVMKLVC